MNSTRRRWSYILGFASLLTGLLAGAYLLGLRPSSKELARYNVDRLFEILTLQQPEYLFLLGVSLITSAFLVKRYWIASLLAALTAMAWVIYYESISVWLLGLGADSFSETQIFDLHEALFFIPSMLSIFVPLEAAFCGNAVVGYTGQGAREYFEQPIFKTIESGNIRAFVMAMIVTIAEV